MSNIRDVNILSLSEITDSDILEEYKNYLGIEIKKHEMQVLNSLCGIFKENRMSVDFYNNFYVGYSIPQISKEFDLLRVAENSIINIELKKEAEEAKILKQLERNSYYLSYLNKDIHLFTFVKSNKSLYMLNKQKDIEVVDISVLVSYLQAQNKFYEGNLNDLFNPSNYLVSPFNSTQKFLEGKYFLTAQQEEIKSSISSIFQEGGNNIISIEGKAGTGKTLLLYDIAKKNMKDDMTVLVIHVGCLNKGHRILNEDNNWLIIEVKSVKKFLDNAVDGNGNSKYDVIIIDETQRIYKRQLDEVLSFVKKYNINCIAGFDAAQTLSSREKFSKVIEVVKGCSCRDFNLTEKIRTNKNIAKFISAMFNLRKKGNTIIKNVSVIHFNSGEIAQEYIDKKIDYRLISYTPSQYNTDKIDVFQSCITYEDSSHGVIGQEFDNVIVIIDDVFFYDKNKVLQSNGRRGNPYDQVKMLFQAVTRVKYKLEIVVVNNQAVFGELLKILNN